MASFFGSYRKEEGGPKEIEDKIPIWKEYKPSPQTSNPGDLINTRRGGAPADWKKVIGLKERCCGPPRVYKAKKSGSSATNKKRLEKHQFEDVEMGKIQRNPSNLRFGGPGGPAGHQQQTRLDQVTR